VIKKINPLIIRGKSFIEMASLSLTTEGGLPLLGITAQPCISPGKMISYQLANRE
jgi:hypothetical protein